MENILKNKKYIDCNIVKLYKKDNILSITENNRKYIANIQKCSKVYKLIIDPNSTKKNIGIIMNGKKCDYGMFIEDNKTLYLIELKGSSVDVAFEQLNETYKWFLSNTQYKTINKFKFRIVASKVKIVPKLNKYRNMLIKNGIDKKDIVVKENELKEPDKI